MKRLFRIVLIAFGLVFLFLRELVIYQVFLPDWSRQNDYTVIRLSPESNISENEDYFLQTGDKILRYSFKTGETSEYYIEVPEEKYIENGIITIDNKVCYYVLSDGTVGRFHCETQTEEEIFSTEDILRMYGREEMPESARVSISRSEKSLLLTLDGLGMQKRIYICPIEGDLKTDCVEVNDLFPEEDMTGVEQEILYQGLRIKRCYDAKKERYELIALVEEEDGRAFFTLEQKCTIKAGEKLVSLDCGWNTGSCSYWVEGSPEEQTINCLYRTGYRNFTMQQSKLTSENGEIIGLVHVVKNYRCDPYDPSQDQLKCDILFKFDPETGENSILYKAQNNRTRVIGYQDGVIYLLKNYRIYTQVAGNWRRELFLKLPKNKYYTFNWQGEYLIVRSGSEIYGAYKVR